MDRYRVFLSSPGDVQIERDRAERVIQKINAERADLTQFELVRWEDDYYKAEDDFQAQIPKPSQCDLVICLFWKRLGTELPPEYTRQDGTIPTGTEFEFEDAMTAALANADKLPDVLVYRKTAQITFSAEQLDLERAQYERFMTFWQRWFRNEKGHFVAGFQSFAEADEFEEMLERHLWAWLQDRESNVVWTRGSPYRGLEPFDVDHAPIFFGRRREVERARARLLAAAMAGTPFMLITGASGAGKSSLARAGLIPRLSQVGGLSTLGASLRWAIVTPGQIAQDWAKGLATALFEDDALGETLGKGDFDTPEKLGAQIARADAAAPTPLLSALSRIGARIAAEEGRRTPPKVALLILIDQLEELFAWPQDTAEQFLTLLVELAKQPGQPVLVVATMRSDFQHRLPDYPKLAWLSGRSEVRGPDGGERTLELVLPTPADFREMIVQPARAAGLTLERSPGGERDLAHIIENEARPEAMPAVQFLLSELYERRQDKLLTLEAYDELGGVSGVMAKRGEEVYFNVDASARKAFPRVVRALVTRVGEDVPPSVRRISATAFAQDQAATRMIDALKDAGIIISDHRELRFAHDSVLKGWKRLNDQIEEEQRLFEARDRIEQLCGRWAEAEAGARNTLLLQGFQLAEGRELMDKWGADTLADKQPQLPDYIAASDAREKRSRRIVQAVAWSIAAVFAGLSVLLYGQWLSTEAARKEAQASLWVAQSQAHLRDGQIMPALKTAAQAFGSLPSEASRSAMTAALFEVSPHLVRTMALGADTAEGLAWMNGRLVIATGSGRYKAMTVSDRAGGATAGGAGSLPRMVRKEQDGNVAAVRKIRPIGGNRLVAVFDQGAIALIDTASGVTGVRPPSRPYTVAPAMHSVAIGYKARVIVTAPVDGAAILHLCDPLEDEQEKINCREKALAVEYAQAVAISPDETRIAVGDESGKVTIFDASGSPIGPAIEVGGRITGLAWARNRDWLGVGSYRDDHDGPDRGKLTVLDVGGDQIKTLTNEGAADRPIAAMVWSPKGLNLAFVCARQGICIQRFEAQAGGKARFDPIVRLEGHTNVVTRLAWTGAGDRLASAGADGTVRLWSLTPNTDASFALYAEAPAELSRVATSPDGRWLAAGGANGMVRIWDLSTRRLHRIVRPRAPSEADGLDWSRAGVLAVALKDGAILLVPTDKSTPAREINIGAHLLTRIAWVANDKLLALPLNEGQIALVSPDGSERQTPEFLPVHEQGKTPWGNVGDREGKRLFASYAGSGDAAGGEVVIWDLAAKAKSGMMARGEGEVRDTVGAGSLSVSADGRWLATSGGDSWIRVYDIAGQRTWRLLKMEANEPRAVAFSPSGAKLAALGADDRVYVWDLGQDGAPRTVVFNAIPGRASVGNALQRSERAGWIAWVGVDSIAVATGASAINVVRLAPDGWQRRVGALSAVERVFVK